MKLLKIFSIIILIAGTFVLIFLGYSGFFAKIKIYEKEIGPYYFVIEDHTGDYSKASIIIDSIDKKLLKDDIITKYGFGIYRDKPDSVSIEKTKSQLGRILEDSDYERINIIERKGYKIVRMGKTNSVVAEFPNKNKLSIMAGARKVYPELYKYLEEKNYKSAPVLEIYGNNKTLYSIEIIRKQ